MNIYITKLTMAPISEEFLEGKHSDSMERQADRDGNDDDEMRLVVSVKTMEDQSGKGGWSY